MLNNFHQLSNFIKSLHSSAKFIQVEKQKLKAAESNINHLNPANILKRGYSITYHNSSLVKSISDVEAGDNLKTVLYEGEITSEIKTTKKGRTKR